MHGSEVVSMQCNVCVSATSAIVPWLLIPSRHWGTHDDTAITLPRAGGCASQKTSHRISKMLEPNQPWPHDREVSNLDHAIVHNDASLYMASLGIFISMGANPIMPRCSHSRPGATHTTRCTLSTLRSETPYCKPFSFPEAIHLQAFPAPADHMAL